MSMSAMDELTKDGTIEVLPAAPSIVSGVAAGRNKPDKDFREMLGRMKKANPGSKMNTWD